MNDISISQCQEEHLVECKRLKEKSFVSAQSGDRLRWRQPNLQHPFVKGWLSKEGVKCCQHLKILFRRKKQCGTKIYDKITDKKPFSLLAVKLIISNSIHLDASSELFDSQGNQDDRPQLTRVPSKDDTLPCKCQALAWQKVPKDCIQALRKNKKFSYQLLKNRVWFMCIDLNVSSMVEASDSSVTTAQRYLILPEIVLLVLA